jgi:hypothetical protein
MRARFLHLGGLALLPGALEDLALGKRELALPVWDAIFE